MKDFIYDWVVLKPDFFGLGPERLAFGFFNDNFLKDFNSVSGLLAN